jgi:hypothetical protein
LPTSGGTETGDVHFLAPIYSNLSKEQTQVYPIFTGDTSGVGIPVTIRSSVDSGKNRALSIWSSNLTGTTYSLQFGIDRSGEFNIGNTNNFYHLNASRGRFEVRSSSSASTFVVDTLTGANRYTVTVFNTDCIHMHTAYVKECTVANTSRKFHSQGNAMQQAYFKKRK